MKKLLLSLAALALSAAAQAQTLYNTSFETEDEFAKWTVVDANADGATWEFDTSGSYSNVRYPYSSTNQADDWLISPALTAAKTGNLMISSTVYGTSYGESMEVYVGTSNEVSSMTKYAEYPNIIGEYTTNYFFVPVTEGQVLYVGFRCTSKADTWRFYMCNFTAKHIDKAVDLVVDKVISPVSAMGLTDKETVKVNVTNNGADASSAFMMAYSINGGAPVVEEVGSELAAGASMEYTFKTPADLSTARQKYTIKAYAIDANDINNANDTTTVTVKHKAPATTPYTMGFETSEETDDIEFIDANEDGYPWSVYTSMWWNFARTGYSCLAYFYNSSNNADDWAILEPINVEAGNYVFRYWYSGTDGHTEKFTVNYGNGATAADMTNLIEEKTATEGAYKESFKILTFTEPQTIYIGFHCVSDKDENVLSLDDIQLYKASDDAVDLVASAINKPYDYVRTPNNNDVEFEVQNIGVKEATGNVTISIDDTAKKVIDLTMAAGEVKTMTAEGVLSDVAAGTHTLTIALNSADDNAPDNNVISKTITVLGESAKIYDFEDGKLPADFSYYVGDEGTVNSQAGEEFNEYGWGIFNIESHKMLGEHMLAGTSWIDNASSANRWVILPQFKVTGDNCYLVWDANSYNPSYLESYKVKVSDGSGDPADWWYSTEVTVDSESTTPKTRGLDLSKYKDKDIYVAFNLVTSIGDALCLDNIAIYGDVQIDGVNSINSDNKGFIFVDENSVGATNATSIAVADMSGRTISSINSNKISTADLQAGVYVAVVSYADGSVKTAKFIKK